MLTSVILLASLSSVALGADSPVWGQCGGEGWSGPTTCAAGSVCTFSNQWYSQCIPGAAATTTASSTSAAPSTSAPANAKFWFSFGDSYTQTGFTPTGTLPTASNPFGNPPYPGWTSSGGANWVGYVATAYNKSLLLTYNLAYGGATIDAALVPPYTPTVLSLKDQVNQFLTYFASKNASAPWTSANALFSIWIGINDIGNSWYQSGDRGAFSDTLLNAEFALVQKLVSHLSRLYLPENLTSVYDVGARNFLFVNVPPVDRSPLMLAQPESSRATEKAVIEGFNSRLTAKISAFKSSHSGVTTFQYDSYAQFTTILNNPTAYGFKDGTSYGTAANQFWFNDLHPSYPAHKLFAQTVGNTVLGNTVW